MADATTVRTTKEAIDAALVALISQYDQTRSEASGILAPFIEGPPGIGKTETVTQLAKQLGIKTLVIVSCGVIDTNLEFIGLPEIVKKAVEKSPSETVAVVRSVNIDTKETKVLETGPAEQLMTKWTKPERLAQFDELGPNERGLLVFDDTHFLLERQQAMMMQLLTNNRTIHTHKVGNGANVGVMFLANRLDDNAGAQDMLAPVIDRVKRIVCDLDPLKQIEGWAEWAEGEDSLHKGVIAFLRNDPAMLYTFNPQGDGVEAQQKFASPRGWANFGRELTALESFTHGGRAMDAAINNAFPSATPELKERLAASSRDFVERNLTNYAQGTVGGKAAAAFSAYYKIYSKYDLDKFIDNPKFDQIATAELSTAAYRFGTSLAKRFASQDDLMFERLIHYVAENVDLLKNAKHPKSPEVISMFEELKRNPHKLQELTREQYHHYLTVASVMVIVDENMITPPSTILGRMTQDIIDNKLRPEDLPTVFSKSFGDALKKLKVPELEKDFLKSFNFMEAFIRHLGQSSPDKKALLCSTFFGAFAGELDRASVRRSGSGPKAQGMFRERLASDAALRDLFIEVLMKKAPDIIDFIATRLDVGSFVQDRKKKKTMEL